MTYTFSFQIHEVAPYINWLYFFHAWGFPARLGSISKVHGCRACRQNWLSSLQDKKERARAQEAMQLYDDAQSMLNKLDGTYQTHARVRICEAYSEGEDIVLNIGDDGDCIMQDPPNGVNNILLNISNEDKSFRLPMLRQQQPGEDGLCWCLSDFVHPEKDKIGVFVCSTDKAMEEQGGEDNYRHMLHQTLADRLAEATAEKVHENVRRVTWGYTPDENLTIEELFAERYQGKRPAVGYPSLPDQSINFLLDEVLDFSSIGVCLTENGAMMPHASTSGLMIAHPEARHFSVGTVGEDQLHDYARRRGMDVEEIRKFLR